MVLEKKCSWTIGYGCFCSIYLVYNDSVNLSMNLQNFGPVLYVLFYFVYKLNKMVVGIKDFYNSVNYCTIEFLKEIHPLSKSRWIVWSSLFIIL